MKKKSGNFVDMNHAREDRQRKVMEDIQNAKECPFCLENLRKYHKEPVLYEGNWWIITKNQWPYENTRLNLIAIYKYHAEKLFDINPLSFHELLRLLKKIEKEENIEGGGFCMRFGDTSHSAATVRHIHAHLIVPDLNSPDYKPVRFKIGTSN